MCAETSITKSYALSLGLIGYIRIEKTEVSSGNRSSWMEHHIS